MMSRFVARWADRGTFELLGILFDEGAQADRWRQIARRWRRLQRVGPGGLAAGHTLNGAYRRARGVGARPVHEPDVLIVGLPTLARSEASAAVGEVRIQRSATLEGILAVAAAAPRSERRRARGYGPAGLSPAVRG